MTERFRKYVAICERAETLGISKPKERSTALMDLESADLKFDLRLDDWLNADDVNFAHDFLGIRSNVNRASGFPAKDFGFFLPRFSGSDEEVYWQVHHPDEL